MIRYKTSAEKCREANAKAYKKKPVFKHARQIKKDAKKQWESIDFGMM